MSETDPQVTKSSPDIEQPPSLTSSISSLDTASTTGAPTRSRLPKPSSAQAQSRISRPCGEQHKPALPPSPNKSLNSSDDSIRRITDDFGRHRLTDVMEEENEEDNFLNFSYPPIRQRYSSIGSAASSSMDTIWDLHPRRLSEAGLSRHSDSSAVLTEDTDSFIIGDRVWVSGTKPGHIAFIGETQFAPGDWAGIALDEPIGKNDGSVGGTRYFQCEPKKGVFARLTRLTRFPLSGMGSGDTYTTSPSPVNNGVGRSPVSPTGSTKGILKSSMSNSGSNSSLHTSASHVIDYKIGDRVIIKRSQGSKVGTVRYIGFTEFAPGDWVGVELDDPRGKNDGSVDGIRYFECRPNFGVFVPAAKVSKSPSKVKPNACQVHSGSGLPPTGMRKVNSKESLTSNVSLTSSATSGVRRVRLGVTSLSPKRTSTPLQPRMALQDVLKEKQNHIEQLLKERGLERAEVTRAATQAEEAERKFAVLQQEHLKYKSDCEHAFRKHEGILKQLQEEHRNTLDQLDEERRKNEDLQFRLAETSISKEDAEITSDIYIQKITELELQLSNERETVEALKKDTDKLSYAEKDLTKAKEEIESLRAQLQEVRNREIALEDDSASTSVLIASLQKESDQYKADLQEREEMIEVLKREISKVTEDAKKSLEETGNEKTELQSLLSVKDGELARLKKELQQIDQLLQDEIVEVEKLSSDKLSSEMVLDKEIERLKMEISAKVLDIENLTEDNKGKDVKNEQLQAEVDSLREQLTLRQNEVNKLETSLSHQEKIIEQLKNENNNNQLEINRLNEELRGVKANTEEVVMDIKNDLNKISEDKMNQINTLKMELNNAVEELKKSSNNFTQVKLELNNKIKEIDDLKSLLENTKSDSERNLLQKNSELEQLTNTLKDRESVIQSLQKDLETTKIDLASMSTNLEQYQTNLSDVEANLKKERDDIKESLKNKINELSEAKQTFSDMITQKDNQLQEMSTDLSEKSKQIDQLGAVLKKLQDEREKSLMLAKEIGKISNDENIEQIEDALKYLSSEIAKLKLDNENRLKENKTHSETLANYRENYKQVKEELETKNTLMAELKATLKTQEENIIAKQAECQSSIEMIEQKDQQIISLQSELSATKESFDKLKGNQNDVESMLAKEKEELQARVNLTEKELDNTKQELANKLAEFELNISESTKHISTKSKEIERLNKEISTLKNEMSDRKAEFDELDIGVSDLLTEIENKDQHIIELTDIVSDLQQKLSEKNSDVERLSKELDTVKQRNASGDQSLAQLQETIQKLTSTNEDILCRLNEACEKLSNVSKENEELRNEVKTFEQILEASCQSEATLTEKLASEEKKLNELQKSLDNTISNLQAKEKLLNERNGEISRLKEDLKKAQSESSAVRETVEPSSSGNSHSIDYQQLLEEKLSAESQVAFLNSIIADMQKKNEEQKAKIEILEMGYNAAAAEELVAMGFNLDNKPTSSRMYCDICEEFDRHETEDCPMQGEDEMEVNPQLGKERKPKPPPRPYCEFCEVFGHATENCTEDTEF